jgi:hypothetical protein
MTQKNKHNLRDQINEILEASYVGSSPTEKLLKLFKETIEKEIIGQNEKDESSFIITEKKDRNQFRTLQRTKLEEVLK